MGSVVQSLENIGRLTDDLLSQTIGVHVVKEGSRTEDVIREKTQQNMPQVTQPAQRQVTESAPQSPTPEEVMKTVTVPRKRKTILTSPRGLTDEAIVTKKKLLGE